MEQAGTVSSEMTARTRPSAASWRWMSRLISTIATPAAGARGVRQAQARAAPSVRHRCWAAGLPRCGLRRRAAEGRLPGCHLPCGSTAVGGHAPTVLHGNGSATGRRVREAGASRRSVLGPLRKETREDFRSPVLPGSSSLRSPSGSSSSGLDLAGLPARSSSSLLVASRVATHSAAANGAATGSKVPIRPVELQTARGSPDAPRSFVAVPPLGVADRQR